MKTRKITVTLAAAVVLTSLAACGSEEKSELAGDWDGIVAAAEEEGSLTLYTSAGTGPTDALVQAFESAYDIDVEVVKGVDSELLPKVETEQSIDKGLGDVLIISDRTWIDSHPDAVVELQGPAIDDDAYDAAQYAPDGTWAATHAFVAALSWNSDEVPDGLADIDDLVTPDLQGKIGLPDPDISPSIVQFYQHLEEAYGDDILDRLAALEPRTYTTATAVMQAIVSGEVAASPYTQPMVDEEASGAPVGWTIPSTPWGVPSSGGALSSAPHPNAAQVFMDFLISQEGQQAYSAPKYATPRSDVDDAAATFDEASLNRPYPTPEETADFRKRFKKLFS